MQGIAADTAGMPLELSLADEIDTALRRQHVNSAEACLSEYSFSNLYLFRHAHGYRYIEGKHPCILGVAYDGVRHLLPLFALHATTHAELDELLHRHDCDCFYPVSSAQLARLDSGHFDAQAQRNDADYLYPAGNFLDYRGDTLSKKRKLVKQLLRTHEVTAQPYQAGLADAALAVHSEWMRGRQKQAGEADDFPCRDALSLAGPLRLEGFVYFIANSPVGFVLAEEIRPSVLVVHFAKGLDRYKAIYPYMFQHFCAAFPRPVSWLNFEQDMGIAGLRRNKLSYAPASLLPKYRVRTRR